MSVDANTSRRDERPVPSRSPTDVALLTVFALAGWFMIKRKYNQRAHTLIMIGALIASTLFLSCYVYYHYHAGSHPYGGHGIRCEKPDR